MNRLEDLYSFTIWNQWTLLTIFYKKLITVKMKYKLKYSKTLPQQTTAAADKPPPQQQWTGDLPELLSSGAARRGDSWGLLFSRLDRSWGSSGYCVLELRVYDRFDKNFRLMISSRYIKKIKKSSKCLNWLICSYSRIKSFKHFAFLGKKLWLEQQYTRNYTWQNSLKSVAPKGCSQTIYP